MTYSPRSGGLDISDNRALVKCMDTRMPLAVFKQVSDKTSPQRSTYLVLGLGLITSFNESTAKTTGQLASKLNPPQKAGF
jgi:hypothetical protein